MGRGGGGFKEQAILDFLRHPPLVSCIEHRRLFRVTASAPRPPDTGAAPCPGTRTRAISCPHCDGSLIVTCWIPLVDATIANGCLHLIPGGHRGGVYRHYTGGQGGYLEIASEDLPLLEPVACPMRAGSVLFMTNLTPPRFLREPHRHPCAGASTSATRTARVPNNTDEDPKTSIRSGNPVTMACLPTEGDFVIKGPR